MRVITVESDRTSKLHRAFLAIELGEVVLEIQGTASQYTDGSAGDGDEDLGRWTSGALGWPAVVIGGGTPNIQRNIIAERILGLPKD